MRYKIRHITEYNYNANVSSCYNYAHMVPVSTGRQTCSRNFITVSPHAAFKSKREDYFGNQAYHFEIQEAHKKLVITSDSDVEVHPQKGAASLDFGISCAEALVLLQESKDQDILLSREFLLDSPMVRASSALKDYAKKSFSPNRPLLSAVSELTNRIFEDFTYSPASTTVSTPLSVVLETKKGVCQDFAHLQVGCLRAMGYPAKYISGYIETLPAPGEERLIGADATHAWISVYSPCEGWFEFDPTNDKLADDQHIITASGRDYYDVTPLRGVIFGGGDNPILKVSVDVARVE